jgi:hypothetical protein
VPGVELRLATHIPWLPGNPLFGVSPKLTREMKGERWGLQVPLLIDVDDKGNLVGGLVYGGEWGGKKEDGTEKQSAHTISILFRQSFDLSGITGIR